MLIQRGEGATQANMAEADRLEAILRTFVDFKPPNERYQRARYAFSFDTPPSRNA